MSALQWGGRFSSAPDPSLLAFSTSLREDMLLARFDVQCSLAHVRALAGGGIVTNVEAALLESALRLIAGEIADGRLAQRAAESDAEDVHGLIDERVREIAGAAGQRLHSGRSRNDQVATTLLLYVRDRARTCGDLAQAVASSLIGRAEDELQSLTVVAGCTHWQPAQPVLLAFVLAAWAEPFAGACRRFAAIAKDAKASCPLGSGALAGSSLPLDRNAAAAALGFDEPSGNALHAIGNRDTALDLAHACVRVAVDASRIAAELVIWATPAFGYIRLGDAASTGSSLMPQKRNPDPFELVRGRAATLIGAYAGALGTLCGLATSYHRDLQETKTAVIAIVEQTVALLDAFNRALHAVVFVPSAMGDAAGGSYTVATDIADALIARGATARAAHALVGSAIACAERDGRPIDATDLAQLADDAGIDELLAPLDARDSIDAKRTIGSTSLAEVRAHIAGLRANLATHAGATA